MKIIRACAQCELEHGLLDRSDLSKSHGLCKRHTVAWIRQGLERISSAELDELCDGVEAGNGFPPDLGPLELAA